MNMSGENDGCLLFRRSTIRHSRRQAGKNRRSAMNRLGASVASPQGAYQG